MTKVTIDRELLERELLSVLDFSESNLRRVVDHLIDVGYTRAVPRQPEGGYKPDRNNAFDACPDAGCDWGAFWQGWKACHADHQRTIAELDRKVWEWSSAATAEAHRVDELKAERDTLRKQLAERDAQIANMRAEVTPFIETHWRPVERQRDKLADLLQEVVSEYVHGTMAGMSVLVARIDATLDEVK